MDWQTPLAIILWPMAIMIIMCSVFGMIVAILMILSAPIAGLVWLTAQLPWPPPMSKAERQERIQETLKVAREWRFSKTARVLNVIFGMSSVILLTGLVLAIVAGFFTK